MWASGFVIERRTPPAIAFREIARVGGDITAFDDVTVDAGTTHCYRMIAFNAVGSSHFSEEACASARAFPEFPRLSLDLFPAPSGGRVIVTATLTPGASPAEVDGYIVVQLPDGSLFSLVADGAAVPGIATFATGFVPIPVTAEIVRYTFDGSEPAGRYTWFAALTRPGTSDVIGEIAAQAFEFAP